MTRRVGWLLTEIERQADGKMSDLARCELVAEVADHLDAAIQARMEMGMEADKAEMQAVKEFGLPKAYVKDLLRVHRPAPSKEFWKGDKTVMTVFWIGFTAGLVAILSSPKEWSPAWFFGGFLIFLIVFSVASFRSRCFRPLPLAKASFFAFLICGLAITLTWHNLWVHGGMGLMPDWQASEYIQEDANTAATLDADRKLLTKGVLLHQNPWHLTHLLSKEEESMMLTAPVLNAHFAYMLEVGLVDPSDDNRITLRPVDTMERAYEEWAYAGKHYLSQLDNAGGQYRQQVDAINAAKSSGLLYDLRQNLTDSIGVFPFLFLLGSFFNAIFGWMGWLAANYRVIRRRRA